MEILDNSVIICPYPVKVYLLKNKSKIDQQKRIKYLTKEELFTEFNYQFNINACLYLKEHYNYSLDNSLEILTHLVSKDYNGFTKLNNLHNIFDDLLDKGFLKINKLFINLFKNKHVYIIGYSKLDKELQSLLDSFNIKYEYAELSFNNYNHSYHIFKDVKEEVGFVFRNVAALLLSGVSLNNIHFYKFGREYNNEIKKASSFYHIPVESNDSMYLYHSPVYNEFKSLIKDHNFIEAINILKANTKFDPYNSINTLIDLIVSLDKSYKIEDQIILLDFLAKHKKLADIKYKEEIKIVSNLDIIDDSKYVFILGFNEASFPYISTDIDFFSDKEKEALHLNTSSINNELEKLNIISFLNRTKNLIITYPSFSPAKSNLSTLCEELNYSLEEASDSNKRYNKKLAYLESGKYYDLLDNYGKTSKYINNFSRDELSFKSYDHTFKPFEYNYDGLLKVSYTQINEYNFCPFHYFVDRILKAIPFEGTFYSNMGNLFHKILEESVSKKIDLNDYEKDIEENFPTNREKFFIRKLLPQVLDVIKNNEAFLKGSYFDKPVAEKELNYNIDDNTILTGKIDKTLIDEADKNLIIVDYKTGKDTINVKNLEYGINMQLPIYSLLLNSNYPEYYNCGMYIQHVCLDKFALTGDYPFKLQGLTINEEDKIHRLDTLLSVGENKSNFITGISVNKDGHVSKKNLTDSNEYLELKDIALDKVKEACSNIRNGKFDIWPLKISNSLPCQYCECKEICFVSPKDYHIVKEDK